MNKFTKMIVAITLLLFMGQTYASVLMTCNVLLNSMPASSHHAAEHASHDNNHLDEYLNIYQNNSGASLDKIVFKKECDTNQHECQCAQGHCSSHVLPTTELLISYIQNIRLIQDSELFTTYHASLPFRPPISA